MADFHSPRNVIGIITQGREDNYQWVTSYKILFSLDNVDWTIIQNQNNTDRIFRGNSDLNTKVTNILSTPICARYVKLQVVTYYGFISLRWDVKEQL